MDSSSYGPQDSENEGSDEDGDVDENPTQIPLIKRPKGRIITNSLIFSNFILNEIKLCNRAMKRMKDE